MIPAFIALARVSALSCRILSVKRTGNTVVHSCRTGSLCASATIRRKPSISRSKSTSSPTKLNSMRGWRAGSGDTKVTRPRDAGLKMVALKFAICAPSALQEVLLCAAIYMSLAAAQMCGEEQQRMILKASADSRQIGYHLDAERLQLGRRPDACPQQERRRMNGATAEHDFHAVEIP